MTVLPTNLESMSFSEFSEAFLLLARQGRAPELEEAIQSFPHLADQIREQLPAILESAGETKKSDNVYPEVKPAESVAGCVLSDEIGRGETAIVLRGYEAACDREVAVKVVRLRSTINGVSCRFKLDRRAFAKLDHPNIVPVYGFSQTDEQAYVVMNLIEGNNFKQLLSGDRDSSNSAGILNGYRSDWNRFAQMALDIASGLEHAHGKGIVHRDLKPANLIVDNDGKVWISDFGVAKVTSDANSLSMGSDVIGSPPYMAPEQLSGKYDVRSDIYSLGVTLYEIATGQKPRSAEESKDFKPIDDIRSQNPDFPEKLAFVIEKACAVAPEDRYQTAAELRSVLFRFLDGKVPDRRKRARKPDEEYRMFFRRNLLLGVVAFVLISVASIGYLVFQNQDRFKAVPNEDSKASVTVNSDEQTEDNGSDYESYSSYGY